MSFIDGIKNFFIPEEEDGRDTVPNDTPAEEPAAEAAPRTALRQLWQTLWLYAVCIFL
ncbi:MAG: hypothetical protein ACLUSL_12655 [Ruminococcus sp.]